MEKSEIINGNQIIAAFMGAKYFDNYYPQTFAMINSETKESMVRINRFLLHQSANLIEATFEAVVEFIKSLEHRERKI